MYKRQTVPYGAQINPPFALQQTVSELRIVLSKLGQRSLSAPRIESDQTRCIYTTVPPVAQINAPFPLQQMVSELWTVLSQLSKVIECTQT